MKFTSRIHILEKFKTHQKGDWRAEIIAGITVAIMLVPQGMAYALLAGMPPIYGLYAGLVPLFIYALFGTSRQMSVGPVAISALLVLAGVSQLAEPMTPEYISLVLLAGTLIGIAQIILGLLKVGFLVNFISHPVIVGFTAGAAIIISINQLKDLLGMKIPRFDHIYETVIYAYHNIGFANKYAVGLCLGSIFVMALLRKINKTIPGALIMVLIGSIIAYYGKIEYLGVSIVGSVPEGLPIFFVPDFSMEKIKMLLPTVFTVTLIGIVESIGIAKVLQSKHQDYQIRANQELVALGLSKFLGSFFLAIPSSGSFSRSAVNNDAGAKSGIASLITAFIIGLTLIFLTPLFYYLPKAVLAAIILFAVKGLIDFYEIKHLWKTHRKDFFMMLITFLVTIGVGTEYGVLVGVLLSIWMVLYRSSQPHCVELGKLPDSLNYRNINRFPEAETQNDVLTVRFDEQLYFANVGYFQDRLKVFARNRGDELKLVIVDFSSIHEMDSTGMAGLKELFTYFQKNNIEFYFAGVVGPVRDYMNKAGLFRVIGEKKYFLKVHDAICFYNAIPEIEEEIGWFPDALQANTEEEE